MKALQRAAQRADIPGMHRVRMSVRENRLVSLQLTDAHYIEAIESRGRGWVVELDGTIVAFAVGDTTNASIWALFVEPGFEGRGFGRQLHDEMVSWLWRQGHERLWLTTDRATLLDILARTQLKPRELLREKEAAKLGLPDPASWSDDEIIDRMLKHPILMNRPIVVTPLGAVLSRPAETVLKILPSWRNSRD